MEKGLIILDVSRPIWDQFFSVFPLVLIGTKEGDQFDLAPKHMAMPMSWDNYFGFVCTPRHRTYQNIIKHKTFTVSYPKPNQVVMTSLAASPRCDEELEKGVLQALPTHQAIKVDGVFLKDAYLNLECELHKIYDDFGSNSLITGKVIGAYLDENYAKQVGMDALEKINNHPLLSYIHPGRFAEIHQTMAFPFPKNFKK